MTPNEWQWQDSIRSHVFEPTHDTSSSTICKWCGKEKFLHDLSTDQTNTDKKQENK